MYWCAFRVLRASCFVSFVLHAQKPRKSPSWRTPSTPKPEVAGAGARVVVAAVGREDAARKVEEGATAQHLGISTIGT